MRTERVIESVMTGWATLIVLARKKNGALRFCVNYGKMNAVTICDL